MVMVRLDACETQDGVVLSDGVPVTGIVAEVDDSVVMFSKPAGRVRLWRYKNGERKLPWTPQVLGDPGVELTIIDENGAVEASDLVYAPSRTIVDGKPLNGWVTVLTPQLWGFTFYGHNDGFFDGRLVVFHLDGSLSHSSSVSLSGFGEDVIQLTQRHTWNEGAAHAVADSRPHRSSMMVARGSMVDRTENLAGYPVAGPEFREHRYSTIEFRYSPAGRLSYLQLYRPDHFEFLAELTLTDPIGWMPLDWSELSNHGAASDLTIAVATTAMQATVAGLGGMSWFEPVRALHIEYAIDAHHLAQFLDLRALESLVLNAEAAWDDDELRRVVKLCAEVTDQRPNLTITPP